MSADSMGIGELLGSVLCPVVTNISTICTDIRKPLLQPAVNTIWEGCPMTRWCYQNFLHTPRLRWIGLWSSELKFVKINCTAMRYVVIAAKTGNDEVLRGISQSHVYSSESPFGHHWLDKEWTPDPSRPITFYPETLELVAGTRAGT